MCLSVIAWVCCVVTFFTTIEHAPATASLPCHAGPDVVVWNLHRRYGAIRLPLLLRGWSQVGVVGWREELLTAEASWLKTYEPVLVLENSNRDEL